MTLPKGSFGGPCNRTACQRPGASWFNHSTRAYYCTECAGLINWPGGRADAMRLFGHDVCTPGKYKEPVMKTGPTHLTIGDLHGRACWHFAASNWVQRSPEHVVVFLGDYVDSLDISLADQADNLRALVAFKQQHPDQVVKLLGNHDAHYLWPDAPRGSGFKPINHAQLYPIFNEHRDLFQIAYELHRDGQKYLWTHAGVSDAWVKEMPNIDYEVVGNKPPTLSDVLNYMVVPRDYRALILRVGNIRSQGKLPGAGGPLWADMRELTSPIPGYHQIVGHTALTKQGALQATAAGIDHTSVTNCDYNEFTLGVQNVQPNFFYQL
jgi:hypothetical protein